MFINERVDDFLKPKEHTDIEKDFQERYGFQYYDLNETLSRLNNKGVNAVLEDGVDKKPIRVQGVGVQKTSKGSSQSWGLITAINKDYGERLIAELYKYGEFWRENEIYQLDENDTLSSTFYITHVEALKILDRLENEG